MSRATIAALLLKAVPGFSAAGEPPEDPILAEITEIILAGVAGRGLADHPRPHLERGMMAVVFLVASWHVDLIY